MSKGNNPQHTTEVLQKLEQIKTLVDECLSELTEGLEPHRQSSSKSSKKRTPSAPLTANRIQKIDFSIPILPFVTKYAKGMSGPKKFTLIVAYLVKGDAKANITLKDVEAQWNKMTAKYLLGTKFNRFSSAQAKQNDWVDSRKTGTYYLRPSWKDIFK